MSRPVAYCILIVATGVMIAMSFCAPQILGDENSFLMGFVSDQLLSVLTVIVSITLASISQLHLTFNRIERETERRFLHKTRAGVKQAAYSLIALLIGGVLIVTGKPLLAATPVAQSLFNGSALVVLLWNVLILIAITQAVFAIGPEAPRGK